MTVELTTRPSAFDLDQAAIEKFLFAEAALLDQWKLDEWLALFTEDAIYEVPPAGAGEETVPDTTLFYISDDYFRLRHRIKRLQSREAHSEFPRSICARMIGNVRLLGRDGAEAEVAATFVTYRSKNQVTDVYPGHHLYRLRRTEAGVRIAAKRSTLALEALRPQGRISIIL